MFDPITMRLHVDPLIQSALEEDINSEDVSNNSVMTTSKQGQVILIAKKDGIILCAQVF